MSAQGRRLQAFYGPVMAPDIELGDLEPLHCPDCGTRVEAIVHAVDDGEAGDAVLTPCGHTIRLERPDT